MKPDRYHMPGKGGRTLCGKLHLQHRFTISERLMDCGMCKRSLRRARKLPENIPDGMPTNRDEARKWVREHWAEYIDKADHSGLAMDADNYWIDDVFSDESAKIAKRIRKGPKH